MSTEKIKIILSLDISTTVTGLCALNLDTGDLVKMDHVAMNKKIKGEPVYPDFWTKVDCMEKALDEFCEDDNWDICGISVEESPKRFTPGLSSADTLFMLSRFSGIISFILYRKCGLKPNSINVRSARKALKIKIDYKDKSKTTKQKVLEQIIERHPEFPWVYKERKGIKSLTKVNEDRCDAYVIAAATRIMYFGF